MSEHQLLRFLNDKRREGKASVSLTELLSEFDASDSLYGAVQSLTERRAIAEHFDDAVDGDIRFSLLLGDAEVDEVASDR